MYDMIMDSMCKDRMIDVGLELFDYMSENGITHDVFTYIILICGLCNFNHWREVKILLKKMIGCQIYPNRVTFTAIIYGQCEDREVG